MKALLFFIVFNVIGFTALLGQSLSKKYVDDWIVKTFPSDTLDSRAFYILNGHQFDADSIDRKLSSYEQSDLIGIYYLDKHTLENFIFCSPPKGIVLLVTKGNQNKKLIRKDFSEARKKFSKSETNQRVASEKPVLIINGQQIEKSKAFSEFRNLRRRDILGVNIIEKPVSQVVYGENGKTGLIVITTK